MLDGVMTNPDHQAEFLSRIPAFSAFEGVADATNYQPLPDDWALATTDIVGSTAAIAGGRYKDVNMAGASMISALLNALGRRDLPFVFGGDGALLAVPGEAIATTRETLAAVQAWVADELGLTLRAALVPLSAIRSRGLDVRVANFQASDQAAFAMFTGGGASWAENQMKSLSRCPLRRRARGRTAPACRAAGIPSRPSSARSSRSSRSRSRAVRRAPSKLW